MVSVFIIQHKRYTIFLHIFFVHFSYSYVIFFLRVLSNEKIDSAVETWNDNSKGQNIIAKFVSVMEVAHWMSIDVFESP